MVIIEKSCYNEAARLELAQMNTEGWYNWPEGRISKVITRKYKEGKA